ncbi:TonB-dependent receptor [Vibrio ostreicida]|uniref:TonB-dependent receptor n=1 Tax=Vibrio ostreicida TaxID=526588 RepID=UPI000970E955|nr:TonB-dependent receptor [Vibrio ostreicida]
MYRNAPAFSVLAVAAATFSAQTIAEQNYDDVMVVESTKQDIPIGRINSSVMIKTGEELENAGIHEVKDLEKAFPGLVIQTRGNRTYANTTIRGMSSPDFYSPTVSIYVDGILQDSAFATQQLLNVEHVELLRGPQGTLYGGNAQGGIINIVTQKATEQAKGSAEVTYSNLSQQFNGSSAVAISDSAYADVVIRSLKDQGNITHLPSNSDDANDVKEFSGVARFHYLPENDPLTVTLSVSSDNLDSHEEWYLTKEEYNQKATNQPIPELKRVVNAYALNIGYDFGDTQLSSITSYQNRNIDRQYIGGQWVENQNTFSQEIRANTHFSDTLQTLFGVYAESRQFDGNASGAINDIKTNTYALFGQTTYALTETVDLTAGLRASYLSTHSDYSGNTRGTIDGYDQKKSESVLSPATAIGWQLSPDSRLFASLASGYRPGGYSHVPRSSADKNGYDAEKSLNGELGWRSSFADNTMSLSGAFYWIKTKDIQLYTGDPSQGNQVLRNMGEAKSQGLEIDMAYYPTNDLTLTIGGTFGKSTFESGSDYQGNTLIYAPQTTAVAGIEYFLPQSLLDGVSVSSHARYTSKVFFNEANTLSQPAYTIVDLSVRYAVNDNLSLRLFGNNITDRDYQTYAFAMGTSTMSNYGTGREIGLNLKMEW